ncbi:hypothetical protein ACLOJK_002099 [Asimina triloba]
MDINFWGSVHPAYFAIPHLRKIKGRVIVISSASACLPMIRMSFYNVLATKAAMMEFYETVRVELGPETRITIVTPGWIEAEMSTGKFLSNPGQMTVDQGIRHVQVGAFPVASTEGCAKAIVNGACRGERYVTDPSWYKATWLYKAFAPENMMHKVVLITSASSGIGEQLAYEYAKRRAILVRTARRENAHREVARNSRKLGSPEVLLVTADVSKLEDCRAIGEKTISRFGQRNLTDNQHNLGINVICGHMARPRNGPRNLNKDVNFWGSIYPTYYSLPHFRKSKGKNLWGSLQAWCGIVNASFAGLVPVSKASIYGANSPDKLYETLRAELGSDVTITIATPGFVESETTKGKVMLKEGRMTVDLETQKSRCERGLPGEKASDMAHLVQGRLPTCLPYARRFWLVHSLPCEQTLLTSIKCLKRRDDRQGWDPLRFSQLLESKQFP